MKLKYTLLLIAAVVTGLLSCKKGNNSGPIVGKWQETKLRLYDLDSSNRILMDTTYLAPFTDLDYVQFNNGGTCITSADHYYYLTQPGYPATPPQAIPQSIGSLGYTYIGGNKYVLNNTSQLANPGGFNVADSAFVSGNTLMIHVINYGHGGENGYKNVTDSYYTR